MSQQTQKAVRFLLSWINNTVAVLVAVIVLNKGFSYEGRMVNLLVASLLLGILNAFVRPILMLIALPLLIFTLGLFTLVINALLLYLVGALMQPHFQVKSFGYAFLGALIISIISTALNVLSGNAKVSVKHHQNPGAKKGPDKNNDGNGPVIDV